MTYWRIIYNHRQSNTSASRQANKQIASPRDYFTRLIHVQVHVATMYNGHHIASQQVGILTTQCIIRVSNCIVVIKERGRERESERERERDKREGGNIDIYTHYALSLTVFRC